MNYHAHVERQRTADATATAVAAIACFAGSPKRHEALRSSYTEHGLPFAAFLLIPDVRQLDVAKLDEVFAASFCFRQDDRKSATEELLSFLGWKDALRALYDRVGAEGVLQWNGEALREVVDEGYTFLHTFGGCMVFGLAPIRDVLER